MEYAKKNFPGHQALVVTHTDGHNHTGNIHVHIVINSVRKLDVEEQDFMERPCDHKAGYKHHQTRALLTHMQKSLMEICQREGLHQIDLLSPAANKINEAEYWAGRRGQKELDQINERIVEKSLTLKQTAFQTEKQKLRNAINAVAAEANNFEDFQSQLFEKYRITVTIKRGRYSYHLPDLEKNISEKSLRTHYGKIYLEEQFAKDVPDCNPDKDTDPIAILYIRSNLRLVTDLQTCVKAQQSRAYAQKVKLTNLKQMAETILYMQEHGYDTREDIKLQYSDISGKRELAKDALNAVTAEIKATNLQIHHLGKYQANKRISAQFLKSRNKKKYRCEHSREITGYEKSRSWLQEQFPDAAFPTFPELRDKKEKLEQRKTALQTKYQYYKDFEKDLRTVQTNVDAILAPDAATKERSKTPEAELS